LIIKTYM